MHTGVEKGQPRGTGGDKRKNRKLDRYRAQLCLEGKIYALDKHNETTKGEKTIAVMQRHVSSSERSVEGKCQAPMKIAFRRVYCFQ
jgi:hypothetical protein